MTAEGNPSETSSSSTQENQGSPQIMATNEQIPNMSENKVGVTKWRGDGNKSYAKEKLLTFDNENRSMSYLMMENNFGLSEYIATYKMQDLGGGAVLVDWSFEVNPIPNSTEQKTADYMTGVYKDTMKKLEALINSQTSTQTTHVSHQGGDSLQASSKETLKDEKLEEGKQV
ncbi:hypothetical protein AXG93_1913s1380 [Marchantia polymorpha subsp. ruderalis]|uniref:Bet v I/Major latex protein domain-containing protein n=1 Tax=Marchantia polymorpha subsp. ruderalis TaxID=1480154 RepID=A0A176WLC2_MARPO|nr:hypothetical protein AXG93_1913s1380 [Marchantia polymorpha subsp. ruderalis]